MANLSNINQAKHNESVCNYISSCSDQEYCDWVITTAFYSAIHYIRHQMFPYDDGEGVTYKSFERLVKDKKTNEEGRHGFQLRMVVEEHRSIAFYYQKLHDLSRNARYNNYVFNKQESNLAKNYLEHIKTYVSKQKGI